MMNNFIKIKTATSIFFAILIFCVSPLTAGNVEKYLERIERSFDEAGSREAQFKIVSQCVNKAALASKYEDFEKGQSEVLSQNVGPDPFIFEVKVNQKIENRLNYDKTNPLMLAISLGDVRKVKKFLTVIEDVNASLLTAWGYRQPYYVAHMALDPNLLGENEVSLLDRLEIINLLGEKGADFNKLPGPYFDGVYDNPPLIVPGLDGTHTDGVKKLLARALLFGADPLVKGSSRSLVCINPSPECPLNTFGQEVKSWCEIAFDDYSLLAQQGIKMRLAESVKERFKVIKEERLKKLMDLPF